MTPDAGADNFSANDGVFHPGRLWSLWDMLAVKASGYMRLGERLVEAQTVFDLAAASDDILRDAERTELRVTLGALKNVCAELEMPVSYELVDSRIDNLPGTAGELEIIADAVKAELRTRLFLYVPPEKAIFYESDGLLTDEVRTKFPLAAAELRHGANCAALEEATASVFHCMRALEHGIGALAQDLSLNFDIQNWHVILNEIEAKIRKEDKAPNSAQKQARLQFLSELSSEFRHFKDAWRNHVSHGKRSYDESEARRVLDHVVTFTETLATQLAEPV